MADVLTLQEVEDIFYNGDWQVPDGDGAETISGRRRRRLYQLAEAFEDRGELQLHDICMEMAAQHNQAFPAKWRVGKNRVHEAWHSGRPYLVVFHEKHGDDYNLADTAQGIAGIYLRRLHQMLDQGWFSDEVPEAPDPQLDLLKKVEPQETRSESQIVQDVLLQALSDPRMLIPCGQWAASKVHQFGESQYGRITDQSMSMAGPYVGDPWK